MVFGLYGARDLLYLVCFELVYCYCKIPISFFAVAVYNDHRNTLNVYMVSVRHKDCLNTASRMTHIRWVKKCKVIFQFLIPYVKWQNNIFEAGSSMFDTFSITRSTFQNTSTLMFRQGHL